MSVDNIVAVVQRSLKRKVKPVNIGTRILVLIVIDVILLWFITRQAMLGNYVTVTIISVVAAMLSFILLYERAYPLRWMAPGLALLLVFSIYPNVLTIYVAFTNYGTGHLVTREQAINQIESRTYLPEGGFAYRWTAFKSADNEYALWLTDADGVGFLAYEDATVEEVVPGQGGVGELDGNGIPVSLEGFTRLNAIQAATDTNLQQLDFGDPEKPIKVRSPQEAAELRSLYVYDPESDTIIDQQTGTVYTPLQGTFTTNQGVVLVPGYRAEVGLDNFKEFILSPAFRGPLWSIISWNFLFPTLSVLSQFGLGLFIALVFNDQNFWGKKVVRSLLLLPQTIPSLITILIWKGMFNSEVGIINRGLFAMFGIAPEWLGDVWTARFVIVLIALWLGYPYFMLVSSGALQSISQEIYQAAKVDGATIWQQFRHITLPLLLVAVGPLLLASYVHNFNNFNLMFLIGGPPIPNSPTPATSTDILISYVYKMAFEGGRGTRFGLASAITIGIFMIVAVLTLAQFRFTNMWEEVSENV
jgi:ABC-type sugar transport system permease subunit